MTPDFESMNASQLNEYAQLNGIDLAGAKKRKDIIAILQSNIAEMAGNQEGSTMEENKELLNEEMQGTDTINAEVPAGADIKATEKRVFTDTEGNEISMSQFIRDKFLKDNMSRKDISEKFDINYRTVYGATVNMENAAEPASRGRGVVNPKIHVTADNKVLTKEVTPATETEAEVVKYLLDGEEIVVEEGVEFVTPETTEIDRNTWIKDQVAAGVNRGDIAKALQLSYGVVYGLTKEDGSSRQKYEVTILDETGKEVTIPRSEYIRKQVAAGVSKADVAKELGVDYSVVWQATKTEKSNDDKLKDIVDSLTKLRESVVDAEAFDAIVASLATTTFKVEEEKVEETPVEAPVEA